MGKPGQADDVSEGGDKPAPLPYDEEAWFPSIKRNKGGDKPTPLPYTIPVAHHVVARNKGGDKPTPLPYDE